jgi:hypothetical protein
LRVAGHARPSAMVTSAVRDRFLADHRRLEALLDHVVAAFAANDGAETSGLWLEFDSGLLTHLEAEETFLIPELFAVHERSAPVLVQEHRHIRARLTDLGSGVGSHSVRLDSLRSFVDELRAHAQTEDRLLYQWADAHLGGPSGSASIEALTRKPTALITRITSRR